MDCDLIREKINILKCWPGSPDSADKAFLSGIARGLEQLLESNEKEVNVVHSRFVNMGGFPACENCGSSPAVWEPKPDNPDGFPPYCYNCGARMDLK